MNRYGELSTAPALRVLVHIDVVAPPDATEQAAPAPRKGLGARLRGILAREPEKAPERRLDPLTVNALWRFADSRGVILEVWSDELPQSELEAQIERWEEHRSLPFRAGESYLSIDELVKDLPYRRDIVGVVDVPERGLRYGSRWIDLRAIW